jgi:signal transduction histidine kinase
VGDQIEQEPILLRHEIRRVVREFRRRYPQRTIDMNLDPIVTPVNADPTCFTQVLQNLVSNAVKYSSTDAPIVVSTERNGHEFIVSVADRGKGISDEDGEMIFEPFYRARATRDAAPGAGIGLAVCKRLVESQGGRIWYAANAGGGAVFSFSLRIDQTPVEEDALPISLREASGLRPRAATRR